MAVRQELLEARARRALWLRRQAADVVARYAVAWQALKPEIDRLTAQLEADRKAGLTVSATTVRSRTDLRRLLRRIEEEAGEAARQVSAEITEAQISAVMQGTGDANRLMVSALGPPPVPYASWTPAAPSMAALQIAGFTASGAPLGELLAELGPAAAARSREALIRAVILGRNPRETARELRTVLGGNAARALTIARTESLRAYREATRASYAASRDVVNGWAWQATLDGRTCQVCWAMHGSQHPVDESLASHPSCRCALVPVTKGRAALAYPST